METPRIADAARGLRHVFLRDLVLPASIGVHAHEHASPQRVRINVDLGVEDDGARALSRPGVGRLGVGRPGVDRPEVGRPGVGRDDLRRVVDYEGVADAVRAIVAAGHVVLVETLAERIAESCLADPRVHLARVRVEKLDVFADAASAGVEIERRQADLSTR
jgi:7,8-dihydroneopterin aldolase/epimerase/oxygenase